MKNITQENILDYVKNVNGVPNKAYANKTAKKEVIEVVVTWGVDDAKQVKVYYNLGVLTGLTAESEDGTLAVQFILNNKTYWTTIDGVLITGSKESEYLTKSKSSLNELLKSDREIIEDLLLASEFVARLENKGYNCSKYRNEIKQLYTRLQARQEAVFAYTDTRTEAQPQLLSSALYDIINGKSIGIAVTTTIIITAVVTVVCASLAWYVYYTYGAESRSDCRKSKELNKILAGVDQETKDQLFDYIDKYADGFYKKAVARTKSSNLFGNIRNFALLFCGGALVYYLNNKN